MRDEGCERGRRERGLAVREDWEGEGRLRVESMRWGKEGETWRNMGGEGEGEGEREGVVK